MDGIVWLLKLSRMHCVREIGTFAEEAGSDMFEWGLLPSNVKCVHKKPMASRHLPGWEMMTHF